VQNLFSNIPNEILLEVMLGCEKYEGERRKKIDCESFIYRTMSSTLKIGSNRMDYDIKYFRDCLQERLKDASPRKIIEITLKIGEAYWKFPKRQIRSIQSNLFHYTPIKNDYNELVDKLISFMEIEYEDEIKKFLLHEYYYLNSMQLDNDRFKTNKMINMAVLESRTGSNFMKNERRAIKKAKPMYYRIFLCEDMRWRKSFNIPSDEKYIDKYEIPSIFIAEVYSRCVQSLNCNPFTNIKLNEDKTVEEGITIDLRRFINDCGKRVSIDSSSIVTEELFNNYDVDRELFFSFNHYYLERLFLPNFINKVHGIVYNRKYWWPLTKFCLSPLTEFRCKIIEAHDENFLNQLESDIWRYDKIYFWYTVLDYILEFQIKVTVPVLSLIMCYLVGLANDKDYLNKDNKNYDITEAEKYVWFKRGEGNKSKVFVSPIYDYPEKNYQKYNEYAKNILCDYCREMLKLSNDHIFCSQVAFNLKWANEKDFQLALMSRLEDINTLVEDQLQKGVSCLNLDNIDSMFENRE